MSPSKDRRRFSRIPFDATVSIRQADNEWQSRLLDISLKGALVERPQGWECVPGATVTLTVAAPNDAFTITMEGSIEHNEPALIGIECQSIDIDSATNLRRLVELNLGDSSLLNRELAELCNR